VIVHRIATKAYATIAINQVTLHPIELYILKHQFFTGHISRDCTEPRSNNYGGGGSGGGYRSSRGKFLLYIKLFDLLSDFVFKVAAEVAVVVVAEVIVTDARNQVILHVIARNRIHVVDKVVVQETNKVEMMMMEIRYRMINKIICFTIH
jgi:hypothetical protein